MQHLTAPAAEAEAASAELQSDLQSPALLTRAPPAGLGTVVALYHEVGVALAKLLLLGAGELGVGAFGCRRGKQQGPCNCPVPSNRELPPDIGCR
jgi:hypothetical protein